MPTPDAPIDGERLELFDQLAALTRDPNLSFAELATRYAEDDPSCPPHRLQHDAELAGVLAMLADPEASPVMLAIGTGDGGGAVLAGEGGPDLAGNQVPDPHRLLPFVGADGSGPVRGDRHRTDITGVAGEDLLERVGGRG